MRPVIRFVKALARPVRNLYYRAYPRLRFALTGQKRILLYVNNNAMVSHIQRYAEPLLKDPAYAFFLYAPELTARDDPENEFLQFVKQSRIAWVKHPGRYAWDLIVCADMRTPASFTRRMVPILYVNHGLHIISMDGGETLYCYGEYARGEDGAPKFTVMCEPNALIVEKMQQADPEMARAIRHTGYKFQGELEAALGRREECRQSLGVAPDTCLVGLFGTWRKESLFHALGEGIFDACHALRGEGYQFLFSIHPNEYSPYEGCAAPMGPLVEAQRERGMLVRNPGEDFASYMAACDIEISDFSSMAESAILFGRKLIFSPYPAGKVWKHSLTAKAKGLLPTLENPEGLSPLLDAVRTAPLSPFVEEARAQLFCGDHDSVMAAITRELLRLRKKGREASHG